MTERLITLAGSFAHRYLVPVAAIAATAVLILSPAGYRLTVTPAGGNVPILDSAVRPGERFTVAYRHSVSGLPVRDVHTIDSRGRIVLLEEQFRALSAGMGQWPGHGSLAVRGGWQVIERIDRPIGDFRLRVGGAEVGHEILFRGGRCDLSSRFPGRVVTVRIRRRSAAGLILDALLAVCGHPFPPSPAPPVAVHTGGPP